RPLDLGDGRIKLDGIWLNLESPHTPNDRNQREAEQECDICLLETVTLPARTEVIVTGKSNANWTTKDGFFEPAPKLVTNHSVMAACSLSRTHRGTVPVRLLNGTDTPITLFKDTKLGTYSTTYSTESTRKTVEAPNAESTRKYSELIENMAKLSHDVPYTIRRRLRTLLWKYKQIIATDEYNTGRTNACKHSINTGDAPPIKQPPRRIPYHQKETMATQSYMACVDTSSAGDGTTERSGYRTDMPVGGYKDTSRKMPDWKQQDAAESITTKRSVDGN
ncbi:hypothetical protein D917_07506, partial [Trichinella nativa]